MKTVFRTIIPFVKTQNQEVGFQTDQLGGKFLGSDPRFEQNTILTEKIDSSDSTVSTSSAPSWKSCDSEESERQPQRPINVMNISIKQCNNYDSEEIEVRLDEKMPVLKLSRSRKLPGTGYYSSNHIMVNTERMKRKLRALTRNSELDAFARSHAKEMAMAEALFHSNPIKLQDEIGEKFAGCRRIGENIAKGATIRIIHGEMIHSKSDLKNMLDQRFTEFGMATEVTVDGLIYLCQIFRG